MCKVLRTAPEIISTVDPWTTQELGVPTLAQLKIDFSFLKLQSSFGIQGGLILEPLQIPKSTHAQVPYLKWCRTICSINPLHQQIPSWGYKSLFPIYGWFESTDTKPGDTKDWLYIYWKKNPCLSGLVQFKFM